MPSRRSFLKTGALFGAGTVVTGSIRATGEPPPGSPEGDAHLPRSHALLSGGGSFCVGYLGGSITEGAGASDSATKSWRARTTAWLRARHPAAEITEVNAAIGGTGSDLGAFRVGTDLLVHAPDLLLVEFAVNDRPTPEAIILRAMEGIVRQVWAARPAAEIAFVFAASKFAEESYQAGRLPLSVLAHLRLAHHYGIPCAAPGFLQVEKILSGEESWATLTTDNVHPNDRGHELYADVVRRFLELNLRPTTRLAAPLPAAFRADSFTQGRLIAARPPEVSEWRYEAVSLAGRYPSRCVCATPGAELVFDFQGDALGVYWLVAADSGEVEWSVDDAAWQVASSWDAYALRFERAHYRLLATELAAGPHRLRLRVGANIPGQSKGRVVRIGAFLVNEAGTLPVSPAPAT